ncbi:MAG: regulatory iron-sulfur-containing complex subunit RicT [Bacteroidales bacterium]|nr:regulatory iron-sulfur-containing complex subunit RicT [Bacteroidales bacterium]
MSESKKYDCFRGCEVVDCEDGTTEVTYREGCCKLPVHNYLRDISSLEYADVFEVRFKNTRKGYYKNESGQSVRQGDKVVVEAASGYDLGFVSLEGPLVVKQMQRRRIDPASYEFKKIYRKARPSDIEKWMAATAREQATMIEARRIAATMGLDMKIGDVEFQGDGTKAIFYYIADGRVDFRQLIKVFAEEFRIKIEMKQIGARQEAGLIGGIGVCGRALCCANYVTNFKSINTSAARCQDLSLNPQKLAGQCGKLKCCINYEVPVYLDAQSRIPKVSEPLEFEDGLAYLRKTDILAEMMYFSYDKSSDANLYPVPAAEVKEIQKMNRNGIRPVSLIPDVEPSSPEFITAVGEGSISRFDSPKKKRKNRKSRDKAQNKQE